MSELAAAETVESFEARIAELAPHIRAYPPEGEGPFPAVGLYPGCGGAKAVHTRWARRLQAHGYAAFVVDSYAHRRIGRTEAYLTVCTGFRLRGPERAGDVYASLEWARRQPWADPARLAAIGWSHGGWTVLDALALRPEGEITAATGLSGLPEAPFAGLGAVVALYPYLGVLSRAASRPFVATPPVLAILAEDDAVVGWKTADKALRARQAEGAEIEIVRFPGATHAFDEREARDLRVRFSPELTAQAEVLILKHLEAIRDEGG